MGGKLTTRPTSLGTRPASLSTRPTTEHPFSHFLLAFFHQMAPPKTSQVAKKKRVTRGTSSQIP
ncbi:hypothetical protein DEO72_LG9g1894 [Vigna unguiculata]|uniref:Uncharacterized protein n=1 Tax=Vigna unguiculata TaxID=3917 RepID=A0A4D6MZ90_VIGUN|nr:hypothetical protein DEO72_LG9g1894 [Vigna unguiculata]